MTVTVRVAEPDASRPASCRRCNDYKRRNPTDQVRHVPSHDRTARGCRNSARSVQRDIRLAGVSVTVIGAFSVPDVPPLYYTPERSRDVDAFRGFPEQVARRILVGPVPYPPLRVAPSYQSRDLPTHAPHDPGSELELELNADVLRLL